MEMEVDTSFRYKKYHQILNEIWQEDIEIRKIQKNVIAFTDIGEDHGLNIPKDKVEINLRRKFIRQCPDGYEVDHIIPKSKGGDDHLSNLQWLPKKMNIVKRDNIYLEDFYFPHCPINIEQKIEKNSRETRKREILQKLAVDFDLEENLMLSLCEALLRYRLLSTPYVMRKLKVDYDTANRMRDKLNSYLA